jgi:hypothetical protein
VFLFRRYVCCIVVSARIIRAITASWSPWTLYTLYHGTILSDMFTRYTEDFLSIVKVTLRPTVCHSVSLGVKPLLRPKIRFLFLSDSYGFVDLGLPL